MRQAISMRMKAAGGGLAGAIGMLAALPLFTMVIFIVLLLAPQAGMAAENCELRGTGDLGIVIERASGSLLIIETSGESILGRVEGLGDLSHASAVFSRDGRYAFVFGRDGGLSKIDLLCRRLVKRVIQAGNSIGGAISSDGKLIAVSNYQPGGVKIFRSSDLELVTDIPALYGDGRLSKTVGLVDAPGNKFVFSLYDAGEIWVLDCSNCLNARQPPRLEKFKHIGRLPYDGLISSDGRYYMAGLFGEDGMVLLDLWQKQLAAVRILDGYGRGEKRLPVYKMPHLEGWTEANDHFFFPAVGHHEVLVMKRGSWKLERKIPVYGQPVFVMGRPDGRQIWVNFAHPRNDVVQVFDTMSMKKIAQFRPGRAVLHMEFTPRGQRVWISVRDKNRIEIYDTHNLKLVKTLPARAPSGIFFTVRAGKTGL